MKRTCALLLALAACTEPDPIAIATIQLGLIPDDVTSIAIWATDEESREVVASATIAPPLESVELGVPAERQLEFNVLARTAQPGPRELGGRMPGWFGRASKRIPLGREQTVLPITAHPAGALSILPELDPSLGPVRIRLGAETGDPPLELELAPGTKRVLALRTGRYRVTVAEEDEEAAMIAGGDGLFVARRIESVGVVEIVPRAPVLAPDAVRRIQIRLADALGNPIATPVVTSSVAIVRVLIEAFEASGARTEAEADVEIRLSSVPSTLILTRALTAAALPAISPPLELRGIGRVSISARALLRDEEDRTRTLLDELRANVLTPGLVVGPPVRLELDLLGTEDELRRGTELSAELITARGLLAEDVAGTLDFSASDPWLFFLGGPSAEVTPEDDGHLIREVARPSGPRGLFVVMRAAFTSTAVPGTLTASVTLPVLESSE